jgi:hypothetical protein
LVSNPKNEDDLLMDIWTLLFFFALAYAFLMYLNYRKRKQLKQEADNPFKLWEMKEQLKCKKCGKTWEIPFKRFDYVFQKIADERAKHKAKRKNCDGEVEVSGIWYEYREETPAEKKWKKFESRFQ